MSKLAMLRTGVVAAGAARGVVSPVFGHSQVAVDTADESDAAQVAQKPRKVPTFLANTYRALYLTRRGRAASRTRPAGLLDGYSLPCMIRWCHCCGGALVLASCPLSDIRPCCLRGSGRPLGVARCLHPAHA